MVRRYVQVTCPSCGHTFMAFDVEDNGTATSVPVTCPKCKTRFSPRWGIAGYLVAILIRYLGRRR